MQLQRELQGGGQHRGADLAVVNCVRLPCRSSAFDCVLDKECCLVQRKAVFFQLPQVEVVSGVALVHCLHVNVVAAPFDCALDKVRCPVPNLFDILLVYTCGCKSTRWCRARWMRWIVQAVLQTLCARVARVWHPWEQLAYSWP